MPHLRVALDRAQATSAAVLEGIRISGCGEIQTCSKARRIAYSTLFFSFVVGVEPTFIGTVTALIGPRQLVNSSSTASHHRAGKSWRRLNRIGAWCPGPSRVSRQTLSQAEPTAGALGARHHDERSLTNIKLPKSSDISRSHAHSPAATQRLFHFKPRFWCRI